jgi:uncharacterized protein YbjQ (UPF0145 family)
VSDWNGQGLPPAAAARMARFRADGVRTSLLDVPGAVAVSTVGLTPVGEVMGCIVQHLGWQGFRGCGYYGGLGSMSGYGPAATVTSGQRHAYAGYRPYVDALYRGYDTAIARMVTEAQTMGADGIVGVRLRVDHLGEGNREFVALGTAVRGQARVHPATPFVTDLAGADVAKLMHSGWVPASIAFGISVAVRHDDYATRSQATAWAWNTEVSGYTDLVTHVRADARARFQQHAARAGADGAIVSSMDLHVWAREPSDGHRDHIAESTVFGTTLARFRTRPTAPTRTLTILPLRRG